MSRSPVIISFHLSTIMKLYEAIEIYINYCRNHLSKGSVKNYNRVLKKMCLFLGETKDLEDVSNREIDLFQSSLISEGKKNNTRLNYTNILRPFFRYWAEEGKTSVIWGRIKGPRKEENLPNVIMPEQFFLIDEFFEESNYYELTKKLVFNLLWDTGVRISELLDIDLDHLCLESNSVKIRTKKSGKYRIVCWSRHTHELLIKYLGVRVCLNGDPELFQTPYGSPQYLRYRSRLSTRTVQRWAEKLSKELGFPINPHAFRHGKMHQIIKLGGNRQHIQTIAGHSSIVSSEVYLRFNDQEQVEIQKRFIVDRRKPIIENSLKRIEKGVPARF